MSSEVASKEEEKKHSHEEKKKPIVDPVKYLIEESLVLQRLPDCPIAKGDAKELIE